MLVMCRAFSVAMLGISTEPIQALSGMTDAGDCLLVGSMLIHIALLHVCLLEQHSFDRLITP